MANLLAEPVPLSALAADGGSWDRFLMGGFQAAAMPLGRATFDRIVVLAGRNDEMFDTVRRGSTDTLDAIAELERRYRNASPVVREAVSRRIERGAVAQRVKRLAGYRCMVCEALGRPALGFRKPSGEPYVEAHHVVPVARLALGSLGVANLMTVCANHHRELHFGDVEQLEVLPGRWRFRIGRDVVEVPRLTSRLDDLSEPSDGAPPQE